MIQVESITLDHIANEHKFNRINLIVDVEGAELLLVKKELNLLRSIVDTLIIELHSSKWCATESEINKLKHNLINSGFLEKEKIRNDYVFINQNLA